MEDIKRDTFDKVYLFSIIGIILFFVPIKINNEFETIIYHLSYFLESKILSFIDISIIFFVGLSTLRDLINYKTSNISKFKIVMKIFSEIILISIFINKEKILFLDGEFVLILKDLLLELSISLPISSLFLPFLLDYGLLEIIEGYTHRIIKPVFNVRGAVFLNFLIYFLVNSASGAFTTYILYKDGKLREKEAVITILNFSVLSLSLTRDLCYKININTIKFLIIEISILIIANFILSRIYPIRNKKQSYLFKSNHKNVNCKHHKMKNALKKYHENRSSKNLFELSTYYLKEVIDILMDLVPTIVFIFFVGNMIYKMPYINQVFENIIYIIIEKFNLPNDSLISEILSFNIFSNILAIKNLSKDTYHITKIFMGIFISLQTINICFLIPFIKNSIINIKTSEIIVVIIEKFFIILLLCCIFYKFYLKYII